MRGQVGDLARMRNFRHYYPPPTQEGTAHLNWTDWKAPPNKVFVALLLGMEDRDGIDELNPHVMLRALGWVPGPDAAPDPNMVLNQTDPDPMGTLRLALAEAVEYITAMPMTFQPNGEIMARWLRLIESAGKKDGG